MSTTVTPQTTVIEAWDAATPPGTTFGVGGVNAPNAGVTTPVAEGTRSTDGKVVGTGAGGHGKNQGSTDVSTDHVFMWAQTLDGVVSEATNGWRIRLSSNTTGGSNYDDITVGGGDTANLRRQGFNLFCCNALRSGDIFNGTPPAKTAVISFTMIADHVTASNRFTWFVDEFKRGTGITLTAGTVGVPGTSADVAADDVTNGTGIWMTQDGVNFLLGRIIIGDVTAATDSHFTDLLETWVFRDQPVKNNFHEIQPVGGTGTNAVTFGSEVGSGVTAVGVAGNLFKSATSTSACFHVINTDADITAHYFGCQFIDSLYDDHAFIAWQHDASAGAAAGFTERTLQANTTNTNALIFPAVEANDDAYYVGDRDMPFFGLLWQFNPVGVGTPTLAFEYWDGSAWSDLLSVVDGTSGLTVAGSMSWVKPADWATTAVGNTGSQITAYYMRIRIVSGTFSTNPEVQLSRPLHAGLMKWEQANAKAVSCLYSGCGPVSIRNGAIIRKSTITDSNAGAVGALDLGAADPATDSVRDLQIQNSVAGILLRKTAAGDVTYNFRNIVFAGNTKDVRVDFPSGSTVTINVLEGGTTPSIENVNTSTVVINNTVTLTVQVNDQSGAAVEGARVRIEVTAGGALIANGTTDASGTFTDATFNFVSNTAVTTKVRLKGFKPFRAGGTITSSGLSVGVTFQTDNIVDLP